MQNIQRLTHCGGVNKYICKYIGKIDEQNYVVVHVNGKGQLVTKGQFLHNTKIRASKNNKDNARAKTRDCKHPQGRAISQNEMVHLLLKYPEILMSLKFIHISTLPLEFRAGTEKKEKLNIGRRDGTHTNAHNMIDDSARTDNSIAAKNRVLIQDMPQWRKHTYSERLTFQSVYDSSLFVDKVSFFHYAHVNLENHSHKCVNSFAFLNMLEKSKKTSLCRMYQLISKKYTSLMV